MTPKVIDLTGRRFGLLTVLKEAGRDAHGKVLWQCQCVCGNLTVKRGGALKQGRATSCGCATKTGHGQSKTPLYRCWQNMLQRTTNPNSAGYEYYGGRGIAVCDRWLLFENFAADMGPTYQAGLTIDRINNDLGYEPSNCRWATRAEQSRNRRNTVPLTFRGCTLLPVDWAPLLGLEESALRRRLEYGWSVERTLTEGLTPDVLARLDEATDEQGRFHPDRYQPPTPGQRVRPNARLLTFHGQTRPLREWCALLGLQRDAVSKRLTKHGWSVDRALSTGADPDALARVRAANTDG